MNKESRQLLNFLKKQNLMLKDDIKQLNQILKLNKQALQTSLMYKNEQNYEEVIPKLIQLLYEQNSKLHHRIDGLKAQIESGMCKALISQQIAFASTQQEVFLTSELRDKLQKLKKELEQKQNKIIELSKSIQQQPAQNSSGVSPNLEFIKLVQYADMNKVTKKLKDSIQKLNQQLNAKKQEIQRLRDGKQQLFKLNLILTKQLNELKLLSSCYTTKSNNQMSIEMTNTDLSKYLKYQKKLINEEQNMYEGQSNGSQSNSSDFSDSEDNQIEQFPSQQEYNQNQKDQVPQQSRADQSVNSMSMNFNQTPVKKMNMTLNLGNLGLKKAVQSPAKEQQSIPKLNMTLNLGLKKGTQSILKGQQKAPKMNIPKLELTKAKQIQNLIVKKINNDQKKKKQSSNQMVRQQKYKKLEDEIENLRKKIGNQIIQKLTMQKQCNFMKKIISQLQQRNSMLVEKKIIKQEEQSYEKRKICIQSQNTETLLDICRDVTLNEKLRKVVMGKQKLLKKQDIQSYQI